MNKHAKYLDDVAKGEIVFNYDQYVALDDYFVCYWYLRAVEANHIKFKMSVYDKLIDYDKETYMQAVENDHIQFNIEDYKAIEQ